jgi:hypothetical protein
MWRPRLVVRYGKGGHTPSSPTTTAGYVLIGGIAGVLSLASVFAAFNGKPLMLLGLLITAFFLRDVWAWFAASKEERDTFRRQVIGAGGGPDQRVVGGRWRWWHLLALGVATMAALAMMRLTLAAFPVAMMVLAVFVAASVDRVREAFRARR